MSDFTTGIHPRLHFWPDHAPVNVPDVAELRRRVQAADPTVRRLYDTLLADAEREAVAPTLIATPHGPDAIGRISGGHVGINMMWRLGLAFHLTGDAKFFQAARRQCLAMADDWCDWVDPYHTQLGIVGDLRTGTTLGALGLAYDWFYHQFTPDERRHLCAAADRRGFDRIRQEVARNGWPVTNCRSNWMASVMGGAGICAMAMLDDLPVADLATLAAERVPQMLTAFGADGGWEEGASYWGGTFILIHYLDALRTGTGGRLDYLRDKRLRTTCWFPLYLTLPPDGLTDFADGGYRDDLTPTAFAAMAAANRDPQLQWATLESLRRHVRFAHSPPEQLLLFFDPTLKPEPPGPAFPLAKAFHHVGWVAMRNGWGDDDPRPVIAAKAGNNRHGGCQHLDVGNVLANAFGHRLLVDHGYGNGIPAWTHTWEPGADGRFRWNDPLYSTPGHNVVVVGGRNQKLDGVGTIAEYANDDAIGTLVVFDCTGAYDGVNRATRTILYLRPDLLVVRDEFDLAQAEPATLAWHTPAVRVPDTLAADADLAQYLPPVRDGHFRIVQEHGVAQARCLSLSGEATWGSDAHRRIGLPDRYHNPMPNTVYPFVRTTRAAAARHVFLSVFAFLPTPVDSAIRWEREGEALRLRAGKREVVVLLSPGAAVAGVTSDATLAVADLAMRRAVAIGGTHWRVAEKAWPLTSAFITW